MTKRTQLTMRALSAIEQAERPMMALANALDAIGSGPDRLEFDKYDERQPAWDCARQLRETLNTLRALERQLSASRVKP